jgi:mesencephalic astrocyte-derived neurotrophic factor
VGVKRQQIAQPLKNGVPVDKICDRLRKTSAEICALRYSSSAGAPAAADIDDYSKLRVNQLKSLMAEKGIKCPDCLEKADYVRRLEEVLGKPTGTSKTGAGSKKKEL